MLRRNSFLSNSLTYLLGSVSVSLLSVFSFSVIVNHLSVSEFGQLSILMQMALLTSYFFGMQLNRFIVIEYNIMGEESEDYATLIGTMLLLISAISTLTLAILSTALLVFDYSLVEGIGVEEQAIALFSGLFIAMITFVNAYLMISERPLLVSSFMTLRASLFLGLLIVTLSIIDNGVRGAILSEALSTFLVSSILLVGLISKFGIKLNFKHIKPSLVFSLPLIIHALGLWSLVSADRFVIEHFLDYEMVGIYSFGYAIASFLALFTVSIDNTWSPIFLEICEKRPHFAKIVGGYWSSYPAVLSIICIIFMSFSPFFIEILGSSEYESSNDFIPLLIGGMFFQGLYLAYSRTLHMKKKTTLLASITLFTALFNLFSTAILVPIMGIDGAAYATLFSYMLLMILALHFSQKNERMELNYFSLSKHVCIFFISISTISLLAQKNEFIGLVMGLLIATLIFLSRRNEVDEVLQIQFKRSESPADNQ